MQGKKLFVVLAILCVLLSTGCKAKENKAYNKGYEEAQTAFEVAGNTAVDSSKSKDNLGLKVEERKGEKATTAVPKETTGVNGQAETRVYSYVINTETYMVHSVDCPQVNLKLPTNQIWKGTLEDAKKAGYTRDGECLGY